MGPQNVEQERLLRQAAIALLAVPVLVVVYAALAAASVGARLRRSKAIRVSFALGLALIVGVGIVGTGRPSPAVATAPVPIVPLTPAAFTTQVVTDRALTEPVSIRFSTAMDPASVAAAITVVPPTPVALAWDATGTVLMIAPRDHWAAATLHTITVQPGALARSGQPLVSPARAAFLTRDATTASAAATQPIGGKVAVTTAFVVTFARPVAPETVAGAINLDPPTIGTVEPISSQDGVTRYSFSPKRMLLPGVAYRLTVSGVRDTDGLPLDTVVLAVRTAKAAGVVRFRPLSGTTGVARDAAISVRFSEAMDRRSTAGAFSVSVRGKPVAGTVSWAEHDTVLVFKPRSALPAGSSVSMDVALGAEAASGAVLVQPVHGAFKTAAATQTGPAAAAPSSGGSGGAVGGGSWASVETYYLGLMNCTRTGGWVTSTGACSSPGGRDVAPLTLDSGISSKVSRPYAKRIAIDNECSHFIGGNPGDRLRHAGYTSYRWAENLGCRSGNPRAAVLASHLFFQSEKSYGGGHYVNLMNSAYNRVGIGVWVSGGRVRLVIDFYHS
jgi:uncharacterized protein YkwD